MTDLLLSEFGVPVVARLTEHEATALQDCGAGLEVRLTREAGVFELRASNYVGTVVLPRRTLRIVPKVPVERLLYLLGFATDAMRFGGHSTAASAPDLVAAMKVVYLEALERLLVRGLRRDYRMEEADLVALRGRADFKQLYLRRFGVFPPIACRYQDYTVDGEANRRLLAALVKLTPAGDRTDPVSIALGRLLGRFDGVSHSRYLPDRLVPIHRDRLIANYEPALSIAETVLRDASLEMPAGTAGAVAFVVDMNKVYERYVARALRAELQLDDREWRTQAGGLYVDEARKLQMLPDVLWCGRDGEPLVVIDTKYKSVERASREDVHQVVTYCSALGLRDAVLLYARCADDRHLVRTSGVRVHQWALSLDGSIDDLREEVARVGRKLRGLVGVSLSAEGAPSLPSGARALQP